MNYKKAYKQELLKQTEPYLYYLSEMEHKERGNTIMVEGPLPCVINIPGIETSAYEFYPADYDIADEKEIITYVILKTSDSVPYDDDSIAKMIGLAIEKTEKLIPDLIYSDNDYMNSQGRRHTPNYKPDFSPHTLINSNYMGGLVAVRREVLTDVLAEEEKAIRNIPGITEEYMQWALLLDITAHCNIITHVTETLWYIQSDCTSEEIYEHFEKTYSTSRAFFIREAAMEKMGIFQKSDAGVSIIIPSKDNSDILIRCIESIKNKTRFNQNSANEIVIIDNGSYSNERNRIEGYIADNSDITVRYFYEPSEFNYAAMCNKGASYSKNELLLFMNDDIEVVSDDFIAHMAGYALSEKVGAVGIRLMYPQEDRIQHIGITSLNCGPTHKLATYVNDKSLYFGINRFTGNCLAVTGACLMITREKFFKVNGFYDKMKVSYNDVDLCVNLYESGLFNVVLADDYLIHYESLTRGSDLDNPDKYSRLKTERDLFYERHPWLNEGTDPFYNRNLIQDSLDYRPDVSPEYEIRDRQSHVEVLSCKAYRKAFHDRLKFNVEKVSVIPSFNDSLTSFVECEGWSLYLKHDNRLFEKTVLFIAEDGTETISCELMPKYRPDIGDVFTDEKYTELAGFVLRIPETVLKKDKRYKMALVYKHRALHTKVITYGDSYESGKLL